MEMKYFRTLETKAKHPEYHLDHKYSQNDLQKILENEGYQNYSDFDIINTRGYEMKQVLRLQKSKIKKDFQLLEKIKSFFITAEKFSSLTQNEKRYYPCLKNIKPEQLKFIKK
jgi:hypothetical protein